MAINEPAQLPKPSLQHETEEHQKSKGMLLDLIQRCIPILKALCKWLLTCLSSCKDSFSACYHTEACQQTITKLENSCIDATRRLYYATGAAVGTAEGLTYAARHAASASYLNVPRFPSIM